MAGITKNLDSFTNGVPQSFIVNSSLSNILISNSSTTESIFVTIRLGLPTATSFILKNVEVPIRTTLQILEYEPLRVQTAKVDIQYTASSSNPNLMTVTYTSS
jgi:hypothetical protein